MIVRHGGLASLSVNASRPARLLLPLSLGVVLLAAAGCGGSSDDADPASSVAVPPASTVIAESEAVDASGPVDDEVVCAELETVQDLSDEVTQSVNEILVQVSEGAGGSESDPLQAFVDLADQLEADLPELLAAFDRAAAAASVEVAAEIRAVAAGTAFLTPALAEGFRDAAEAGEMFEIDELMSDVQLQDAAQRAGISSLRLDIFTNPTCGFQFSDS